MRVQSFIQKCHNCVINKVSSVGQPARARDVRNRRAGRDSGISAWKKEGWDEDAGVCRRSRGAASELPSPR